MSNRLNAGQSENQKAFVYVTAKSSRTAFFSQLRKSDKLRLKVRDLLSIYIFIPGFKYMKSKIHILSTIGVVTRLQKYNTLQSIILNIYCDLDPRSHKHVQAFL